MYAKASNFPGAIHWLSKASYHQVHYIKSVERRFQSPNPFIHFRPKSFPDIPYPNHKMHQIRSCREKKKKNTVLVYAQAFFVMSEIVLQDEEKVGVFEIVSAWD